VKNPLFVLAALAAAMPAAAHADMSTTDWSKVTVVHYEVVGEIADPHVQIPPTDADLYADVTDRVTLSFDWDTDRKDFVGAPKFENHPGTTSRLMGMEEGCPTGSINGPYEHFDIVEVKRMEGGSIELAGKRVHPETSVAESCGAGRRAYPGAEVARTEYIAPPDPGIFALLKLVPAGGPMSVSPDGKSIVMTAQNNNWTWTFTPTAK
jgi:hypothetical protein